VPGNKLSAKEAALIAQARSELDKNSTVQAGAMAAAPGAIEPVVPPGATPASALDPAARIAAVMAAARAESERQRRRQRQFYVWAPIAFMFVAALWTLLWLWHKL
jgi:hypothetical protein